MKDWQKFKTYKERGEWVEMLFMAAAALHGFHVLKPWGDSLAYDVGIEHGGNLVRVQVKSSADRGANGYRCQLTRGDGNGYCLDDIDLFAAYVIPETAWYLIPGSVILKLRTKASVVLCPAACSARHHYEYEKYREAWGLLGKDKRELACYAKR